MRNRVPNTFIVIILFISFTFSSSLCAEVSLPKVISDGMVVQRDKPVSIWGWATVEENIHVYFEGREPQKIPVRKGRWQVDLKPLPVGGPYRLHVQGQNKLVVADILSGELWVASGQSNMETPMSRLRERFAEEFNDVSYPMVRQFSLPKEYDFKQPRKDYAWGNWQAANAETIDQFSAVGYFFAKSLYQQYGVPVGFIAAGRGGASAEGWMSEEGLKAFPHYLTQAKQYADDDYLNVLKEADKKAQGQWTDELNKKDEGLRHKWHERDLDFSQWPTMTVPGYWEDHGLAKLDGVVWFKTEFDLTKAQAAKPARLKLGRLVDADKVYVNQSYVGETSYQYPPRRYDIKPGILQPGRNTVTVRIVNNGGKGGFVPDNPYEVVIGEHVINLQGTWHFNVGAAMDAPMPSSQFNQYTSPLGYHNAMLAPLLNLNIRGVIFYQGESNVGKAQEYYSLFPALIRDWRRVWKRPELPFIYVQLANYLEAHDEPTESQWAHAREAQRLALSEPNTAMAVAIDVGEWNDIHPLDKKTVGKRLSLAARHLVYGEKNLVYSGPSPTKAVRKKNQVTVHYDHLAQGLVAKGDSLNGFALAGKNKKFYWANAQIKGKRVVLQSEKVAEPHFVRYAWADNPDRANLYNSAELPAVPFQMPVK